MEQVLILPECEVFQETPIKLHRKYWQDDDIWGVIKSYPQSIRKGFEDLKETIHLYISNGYSDRIQEQYPFDEHFLRVFCHHISETECLERSFARAGGIVYEFGLEWGKLKILHYYRKFGKNPPSENGFFYYFKRDCKKGVLKQYGIYCWVDLLEISLQDHTFFQRERQSLKGYIGLQRAKIYLKKQYKNNGKIPMSKDTGNKLIAGAIHRNFWGEFGITTWGDLIFEVFGYIKGTMNLWKGGGGLDRAISWIKDYFSEHGKLPSTNSSNYCAIIDLVSKKFWTQYGINTMDDLTLKACGIIDSKKRRKSRKGIKGLERTRKELIKYYNDHQKLPLSSMFQNIYDAIKKGYWTEFNIGSWNDLLRDTFGRVNVAHKSRIGQGGLEKARKELKIFFKDHQKLPTSPMFSYIVKAIRKGYWKEYNIRSWNDLLFDVFGRVNRIPATWKGSIGFNRAKKTLRDYKIKYKKYPKNNYLFRGIKKALDGNYWAEFRIFTWEDLIQHVFHEYHNNI